MQARAGSGRELLLDPSPRIHLSLTLREPLPSFPCLWGLHEGCDRQETQIYFTWQSHNGFHSISVSGAGSNWIPAEPRCRPFKISQQQMMCCSWISLRAELFAQNKAVINAINYLQEAGLVSQHLPVFILVGKNPTRAGSLGFLTEKGKLVLGRTWHILFPLKGNKEEKKTKQNIIFTLFRVSEHFLPVITLSAW